MITGGLQAGPSGIDGRVLGVAVVYWARLPQRLTAALMAVGTGVLISAVAFDLMDEAYARSGFDSTVLGLRRPGDRAPAVMTSGALAFDIASRSATVAGHSLEPVTARGGPCGPSERTLRSVESHDRDLAGGIAITSLQANLQAPRATRLPWHFQAFDLLL